MEINVEIGRSIVRKRKQLGITQEYLALEAETSVSYLRQIEHGTANPTIKQLERIAAPMGMALRNPFYEPREN